MNSIATQHGDGGRTRLIGCAQVSKSELRIEDYGAIDELGAALGFAHSISGDKEVNQLTKEIQRALFLVAGSVANPRTLQKQPPDVTPEMADHLTREVHRLECLEGMLSDWVLPGDHTPSAAYDLARSVCRRAERCVVRLREAGEEVIRYLNRLSDLLWLFGRTLELRAGVDSRLREEARRCNQFSRAW